MKVSEKRTYLKRGSYLSERLAERKEIFSSDDPRIKQWLEVGGFTEERFRDRLAKDGLTLDDFTNILSNKEIITRDSTMMWASKLDQILDEWEPSEDIDRKGVFITFYEPFLFYARAKLEQELQRLIRTYSKDSFLDISEVVRSIIENLYTKLYLLSIRTLVSEMHIAKVTDQLKGESSEERYQYFVDAFLKDKEHLRELFQIYPVLARLMVETVERVIATHLESIERFLIDLDDIRTTFVGDFSYLTKVEAGAGDTHQEGRSVSVFTFASGDRLVYKPRSMAIDEHYNDFITWINEKGFSYKLSFAKVLNRDTYGWQEFISARECESREEIQRFYYRQGGYIAILYLFRSSDFHAENIIAHGEYPILIDLETLFSNPTGIITADTKIPKPLEELNSSVFASLMLPVNFTPDMLFDFDLSALGGEAGQVSKKIKNWVIDKPFTDEMRLVQKPAVLEGHDNRPYFKGEAVQAADFVQEIEAGFREMYQIFLTHREELLAGSGPIFRFKEDRIRHVMRPTHTYAHFLEASTHPDYLQDGLQRVRLFDYFWRITSTFPKFSKVVSMECRDMLEHDIPFFTFEVGGKDIYDGKGYKIPSFYEKTCIELLIERCQSLSKEDCDKQVRYIRMSLATLVKDIFAAGYEEKSLAPVEVPQPLLREEFLNEAIKIGDELFKQAVWSDDGEEAYWIGLSVGLRKQMILSSLGPGLYEGTLGILLFLGHLAKETGEERYEHLAKKALNGIFVMKEDEVEPVSAFYGNASISYGLAHLGLIWDDDELIQKAYEYLYKVENTLESDKQLDLLGGAAGALLVSLRLNKLDPHSRALEIAEKCGEHLLQHVQLEKKGENASKLLTGLSHGAAGYAWAWLELADATGQERFLEAGRKALAYEKSHFIESKGNWADLRDEEKKGSSSVYWCHGAPGIGLSRLMILNYFEDPDIYEEWQIAVRKTLESGFGHGHSLCHGDFGNLDFLLSSAKRMKDRELEKKVLEIGYQSMQQGITQGWQFGLHKQAELIGFMLGLSGIGYSLLRLWNPQIPSVLSLELPITN